MIIINLRPTRDGSDLFTELKQMFPDSCPECNYQDKKKTFIREDDGFHCDSCNYVLKESDFYASVVE